MPDAVNFKPIAAAASGRESDCSFCPECGNS